MEYNQSFSHLPLVFIIQGYYAVVSLTMVLIMTIIAIMGAVCPKGIICAKERGEKGIFQMIQKRKIDEING